MRSDSELLVRQMQGRYKVKSADLRPLYERARKMARGLAHFAIEHVPREQNREADELANLALDRTGSRQRRKRCVRRGSGSEARSEARSDDRREACEVRGCCARQPGANTRQSSIRARYSAGALHPLEALDLDEGEIVE